MIEVPLFQPSRDGLIGEVGGGESGEEEGLAEGLEDILSLSEEEEGEKVGK
jgi:hypothetical protein